MTVFDFTLTIEAIDILDDDVTDSLYEAGCGDATLGSVAGRSFATFHRFAEDFAEAVSTAITQVETTVPGARVTQVTRAPESAPSA